MSASGEIFEANGCQFSAYDTKYLKLMKYRSEREKASAAASAGPPNEKEKQKKSTQPPVMDYQMVHGKQKTVNKSIP
ncbi:hypothetical protein TNCV_4308091 [Trichonephila clavipes]|nr:hypothetical protein TNCV_4308091 [Trichonephila clavipes]